VIRRSGDLNIFPSKIEQNEPRQTESGSHPIHLTVRVYGLIRGTNDERGGEDNEAKQTTVI
jgi:hypothetical protein